MLQWSLLKWFPLFIWLVCPSLQCLISALTQASRGGLLFRFACSVVVWGRRGAADKCHWCVWGALAVFRLHWVCPSSWRMCFPRLHCSGSRLLYKERVLSGMRFQFLGIPQKRGLGSACILCHPRPSSSGSQELEECPLSGCSAPYPLCSPNLFPRVQVGCALCLFWGTGL